MAFRWRADAAGQSLNARMITMIFQGIRTRIAEKPYIFVIFRGGGASGSADVLWRRIIWRPSIFYCCSHCIRGLPNYVVLSRRKRTSRRKNQLQTTFICQGRRTVLCPWASHIYPCFSTGSTQEDTSRYIWIIVDWEVKNQINTGGNVVRGNWTVMQMNSLRDHPDMSQGAINNGISYVSSPDLAVFYRFGASYKETENAIPNNVHFCTRGKRIWRKKVYI